MHKAPTVLNGTVCRAECVIFMHWGQGYRVAILPKFTKHIQSTPVLMACTSMPLVGRHNHGEANHKQSLKGCNEMLFAGSSAMTY